MLKNTKRKGFTLIELLIVVVIIGILAAIAIPKFAATKDKAKLGTVKTDVRNIMGVMEGRASDNGSYVTLTQGTDFTVSNGNTATAVATGTGNGYTITVTNSSITSGHNRCTVTVGSGATAATDGVIVCSAAAGT
jgi:type IV pilus assembly protein PilA